MGQALPILLKYCGNFETVLIQTILGWLTPIDQDFGPFAVELHSASVEDDDDTHIDLKEFNLEGVGLHGKVTADIPGLGRQELPINLSLGMNKSLENRACQVQVHNFDFDENDHAGDPDVTQRGLLGDIGGMMGGLVGGSLLETFKQILQMDAINSWVCDKVSSIVNQKISEHLGDGDSDGDVSDGDSGSD
uniref:Lipid-binding serum glycoprotein N-terminal domain-containing protein n=1 Tax=Alexandrium catenella TaxID=2925 RepID=A0A7S1ML21_ALECA